MSMKQKVVMPAIALDKPKLQARHRALPSTRWLVRRMLVLVVSMVLLGSSAIPSDQARVDYFGLAVGGYSWDLAGWEVHALFNKVVAAVTRPADKAASVQVATTTVKEYLDRAAKIGGIQGELARRVSQPASAVQTPTDAELSAELSGLRSEQDATRAEVEQIIEGQVGGELVEDGFVAMGKGVWPPVSFGFVEPPKKLVVSRRDRIETIYSEMLDANISLAEIQAAEAKIVKQENAVAYITDIGGLGAFPTMVVDQASLGWVLSTVAHEWTHNYLAFYPLGWNYFKSQDMTTMNESVAEIVGNEAGDQALAQYYPELVPPPASNASSAPVQEPAFDFQLEMQRTRKEVDRLLAAGDIEGAEAYMGARRQVFVENGYPLRVLNQAYFAFHGSYGTSPASTSPIGPKLDRLRASMPDLKVFLETVRAFSSADDLDHALSVWEAKSGEAHSAP
jgi:hypothetical protein